jgi:hypothetical protein
MSLRDDLSADLAAAVGDYDDVFEWRGNRYACVRSRPQGKFEMLSAGGYIDSARGTLVVVKSLFARDNWPQNGDMIDGDRFQIIDIDGKEQPSTVHLMIHFGPPDGGVRE